MDISKDISMRGYETSATVDIYMDICDRPVAMVGWLVGWSLTSLSSTNIRAISETRPSLFRIISAILHVYFRFSFRCRKYHSPRRVVLAMLTRAW